MNDDMNDLLKDAQTVLDRWFATCLVYAGYELVSIKPTGDKRFEFTILCPQLDFESLKRDFHSGQMTIADAKALGNTNGSVGRIVNDVRQTGQTYLNPDFERLQRN